MRKRGDQAHIDYQNKISQFQCPVCNFKTLHKNDIGAHITKKSSECALHRKFYDEQISLVQTLFEQGNTVSQIVKNVDICFGRAWICNILRELKGNIKCRVCNEVFRNEIGLTSHLGKQVDVEHQQYLKEIGNQHYQRYNKQKRQCPVLGCSHKSVWLDRHMQMKIEQGDQAHIQYRDEKYKHNCPVCNRKLQSQQALMGHIQNLSNTDESHKNFMEEQRQKIIGYFEAGLCVDEIMKQPDIIYSFADGISPIIHDNFSREEIHQRGRQKCGEKNKELIAANPKAFFERMQQARTQGSQAQRLCAKLLKERLPDLDIKEFDQDIFVGKEIDITIPELKVAIEWQGPPHRRPIFGEKSLKNMQRSDKAKRTYFKRIGWILLEVDDDGGFNERFVEQQVAKIVDSLKKIMQAVQEESNATT